MARTRADAVKLLDKFAGSGQYYGRVTNANTAKTVNKPAPFSLGGFASNVGKSAVGIATGAVKGFYGGLSKAFTDTAGGIVQASQTGANLGAIESRRAATDAMFKKYTADYKAGKINKDQFNRALKSIQDQSLSASGDIDAMMKTNVAPGDFVQGALTVGTLPFAAGKMQGLGYAGKGAGLVGKVAPSVVKSEALASKGLLGSQKIAGGVASALVKAPFKQALITGPNAQVGSDLIMGAVEKDPSKFASAAAWAALPAGISLAGRGAKALKAGGKNLFFDSTGIFDNIQIKGGKSVTQSLDDLAKKDPDTAKEYEKVLRIFQDNMVKQHGDDPITVGKFIEEYLTEGRKNLTVKDLITRLDKFATADQKAESIQKAIQAGKRKIFAADGSEIDPSTIRSLGAVKSTQSEVASLAKALKGSKTPMEAGQTVTEFLVANPRFKNNKRNMDVLEEVLNAGKYGDEAAGAIKNNLKGTNQLFIKTPGGKLKAIEFDGGYYLGERTNAVRFAKRAEDTAQLQRGKSAALGGVGKALRKTGLSPETITRGQSQQVFKKVKDNFLKNVDDLKLVRESATGSTPLTGSFVFGRLEKFAEAGKKSVTDLRQLTAKEAAEALGLSQSDGRKVIKAYKNAFKGLGFEERGLAGKIQDLNLRVNPLAAPYSRVQAAARYTYNPFFWMQEGIETRAGVASLAGTTARPGKNYQKTINTLKDKGVLSLAGAGSEGADVTFGTITSRLRPGQEKTVAAGVEALAEKQGKSVLDFLDDPKNADLIQDFKTVVQYPDKGFTSSNMSKMLNLVVFPARYNIKVAQFAAKQLAKQPGPVQIGVVKSIKDFVDFTESEQGIKWQSENSELLGLLNYFTPIYPISQVYNTLRGKTKSVGDLGSLGGLPFGIISQVLQNQGVIPQLNRPYVNPKTGEVYEEKIPTELRSRAHQLLSDLIGTMYNYPGRTVGLPSKRQLNETFPTGILGQPKSSEYTKLENPELTASEKKRSETIQSLNKGTSLTLPSNKKTETANLGNFKKSDATYRPYTPSTKSKKKGKKGKTRAIPIGQPF